MDGIGDSRIGPTALNHGWHLAHAVCSLLEKTERILEAPERNLTSLGSFWCNRIVGISLETFVFRKNHFPCTHVDILITKFRATGPKTESCLFHWYKSSVDLLMGLFVQLTSFRA